MEEVYPQFCWQRCQSLCDVARQYLMWRQHCIEDDLGWTTTSDGRLPLIADNLWWNTTFCERQPYMEDDLKWIMTLDWRWPLMEDNLWWKAGAGFSVMACSDNDRLTVICKKLVENHDKLSLHKSRKNHREIMKRSWSQYQIWCEITITSQYQIYGQRKTLGRWVDRETSREADRCIGRCVGRWAGQAGG